MGTNAWASMGRAFDSCSNLNIAATDIPVLTGVTDMHNMFAGCEKLDPQGAAATALNNWHTEAVTNMAGIFFRATTFNHDIGNWNTANVTDMEAMFQGETAFNQDIGHWNTVHVTNMRGMFQEATAFDRNIGHWNTTNVTDMGYMFWKATTFNQDIGHWNTAKVTDMYAMFWGATAFNQDIGNWKIAYLANMLYMLDNSGLSVANYDQTLIGWAAQAPPPILRFSAQGLKYCAGADARRRLVSTYGWGIYGDSLSCVSSPEPKIFPNPATGPLTISNIQSGDAILLTDAIGRKLLTQLASGTTSVLDISLMAQGIYFISIIRAGRILITKKITKLS